MCRLSPGYAAPMSPLKFDAGTSKETPSFAETTTEMSDAVPPGLTQSYQISTSLDSGCWLARTFSILPSPAPNVITKLISKLKGSRGTGYFHGRDAPTAKDIL